MKKRFNKKIILFLLSQNISLFGSSVVGFTIIWYITLTTSSGLWLMLATISSMLPQVIISFFSGVWADRYNRKYLIMLADGFIAIATLLLAISFLIGFRNLKMLLAVAVIRSIGAGIQTPAVNAIYPDLVSKDKLVKVQGLNQTLASILLLLAPAVGGLLLGPIKIIWAFMLDVITALIAITLLGCLKIKKQDFNNQTPFFKELKRGLKYTFQTSSLRLIVLCYMGIIFLITPITILSPLLIERTFGCDIWRLTISEVIFTLGSLIGGLYVSLSGNFKNKTKVIWACLLAFGITFSLLGMVSNFTVYVLFMGVTGIFMPIVTTLLTVFIQNIASQTMLGRVFSIIQIVTTSTVPLALLIFGPLADLISINYIFIFLGFLAILASIKYKYDSDRLLNN